MSERSPEKIAVFDLNQTVYLKSSKEEFYRFICYKNNYKLLDLFQMGVYTFLRQLKLFSKTEFKENFFNYLDHLPPEMVEEYAREYWSVEYPKYFHPELLNRIAQLREQGVKIIFITGTLDVYVKPLFEHFLIPDNWIATRTQYINGSYKIIGKACKDDEKINRLNQLMSPQSYEMVEAYSDKNEDILKVAKNAFLVQKGHILSSPKNL